MSDPDLRMLRLAAVLMRQAMGRAGLFEIILNIDHKHTHYTKYREAAEAYGVKSGGERAELYALVVSHWLGALESIPDLEPPNHQNTE